MKSRDLWKLSMLNVVTTPMRSLLTVLGMAIGIGAILAVLTLGDAGKVEVENEMMRLGIDKVWLTAENGFRLEHGDADMLARTLGTSVTEQVYCPMEMLFEQRRVQSVLVGCSREYLQLMDTTVLWGRNLWPLEWEKDGRSVLIGEEIASRFGIDGGADLNKGKLSLGGMLFTVAGVIRQSNELSQVDSTMAVYAPINVYCAMMGSTVHELTVSVPKNSKPQAMAVMAVDVFKRQENRNVQAVTMQVQIEAAGSVVTIFVDVLGWVAMICILVGGIGVMNILLVSVRERRREIGIMKSLGATAGQVRGMFLTEALMYAVAGGALGVVTGIGLIGIAGRAIGLDPVIRAGDVFAVVLAAIAVGLFFGVVPASRASRMTPVDALRE